MNSTSTRFKGLCGPLAASVVLLFFTILVGMGCGRPPHPVARVGGEWIGQPQWKAYLSDHPAATLDALVRREVAWIAAGKANLLKGDGWDAFQKQARQAALVKAYLAAQPGPPPFTEAQARTHFLAQGEECHVLHLVCKERVQAEAALRRIKQGESFEKVATAVSIDPSKLKNRGDLGWIKREQVVKPFGDAVFSAKLNELCGPFKSDFGWHVALVKARKELTEEDFTKNKVRIMHEMEELNEKMKRPAVLKALRAEYPVKVDLAVLGRDRTTVAAPGDDTLVAAKVGNLAISLKELKQFLASYMKVSGQGHGLGQETKKSFLEIMADELRLAIAAEKAGLAKRPEVLADQWEAQREAAFAAFSKSYLANYKVADAELKAHFESYPDRFRAVGAVKLNVLVADESQTIDKAAKETMAGAPWQQIFNKYANKVSTGNWDVGWVELAQLQRMLPKEAIQAMVEKPAGTLIGPVPGPEGYMLFKVLERRPGALMALDQCRELVRLDFLKERGAGLLEEYLNAEGRQGIRIQEYPKNATASLGA